MHEETESVNSNSQASSGKHYTYAQKYGLNYKEWKLRNYLIGFECYFDMHKTHSTDEMLKQGKSNVYISRIELNDLINDVLGDEVSNVDRYTVYDAINLCRRLGYIKPINSRKFFIDIINVKNARHELDLKISAFMQERENLISLSNNTNSSHALHEKENAFCEANAPTSCKKEIKVMQ